MTMARFQTYLKDSDVVVTIHRGIDQIGGCITEISTKTSCVFVDFGQNLPGCTVPTTPEQDEAQVRDIFAQNVKQHQAVVYTHAHEDHVGLFDLIPCDVPQYIGVGGQELMLAKYDLLKIAHEQEWKDSEEKSKILIDDEQKIRKIKDFHIWERTALHTRPKSFMIGDIRITPFFNSHSIYDSYMFLIEADGKRIWHTGDYRDHGYLGKGLYPTLHRYASNIDLLITEGTTLKRGDLCIQESEVSRRMACVMSAFKYVIVLASATDIERLASVKTAALKARKGLYYTGGMMGRAMRIFTHREAKTSKGLFAFHFKYVGEDDPKLGEMQKKGFVLVTGASHLDFVKKMCQGLSSSEVLLIYSAWDGYYKDPLQVKQNPAYRNFREAFPNVVDIHTSGHASRECIKKVIDIVKPKEVICIHREAGAEL